MIEVKTLDKIRVDSSGNGLAETDYGVLSSISMLLGERSNFPKQDWNMTAFPFKGSESVLEFTRSTQFPVKILEKFGSSITAGRSIS